MAQPKRFKMLWHHAYWDNPRSGLGEFNGGKVWFQMDHDGIDGPDEKDYTLEIKEIIKNHKFNEDDDDCIGSTADYEVNYYPDYTYRENYETKTIEERYTVNYKLSYKLYKLPDDVLERVEKEFDELCDLIGNGCWHDPTKYSPCYAIGTRMEEYNKYYEKQKTNPLWIKVSFADLEKYECLGSVNYDEIEWLRVPK